jgi:hypothetical protein
LLSFLLFANKADKPIFGIGGAMQFLVYYCATDMLQCQVINGEEKGSGIETISEYNKIASKLKSNYASDHAVGSVVNQNSNSRISRELLPYKDNFLFLDHSNGDYYGYNTPTIDASVLNHDTSRSAVQKGMVKNYINLL